jgi:hypothetical protein
MIAAALLAAAGHTKAELITFEAHGHMISDLAPDFQVGDKFVAVYTFDPATPADGYTAPDIDGQYEDIVSWRFDFDSGYSFGQSGQPIPGYTDIGNDKDLHAGINIIDRYIVTFTQVTSIGMPIPSGRQFNFFQIDMDDYANAPDLPDMLSGFALPTVPPSPELSSAPFGRLDYDGPGISDQPFFVVDSLTLVPEPPAAVLSLIGALLMAAVCATCHRRTP